MSLDEATNFDLSEFNKIIIGASIRYGKHSKKLYKFIKYNKYQRLNQSDYVAISDVGAYGASLSSNYNTKPLIAEIIISKSKARVIRKKQDIKSLLNQ